MTATINASTSAGVVTTADTSGILQLQTNGTAALTVDASQNVGIGITSPTRKLAVSGTWTNTGDYLMDSGDPQLAWTSGTLRFKYGGLSGTEAMRIDSSGNVGIGTTAPTGKLNIKDSTNTTLTIQGDTGAGATFINFSADAGNSTKAQLSGAKNGGSGGDLIFSTANSSAVVTERARIDISGNLLLGGTTQPVNTYRQVLTMSGGAFGGLLFNDGDSSAVYPAIYFRKDGAQRGNILVTTSGTTYNTVSDYRLKEDVVPMVGALAKVSALKPVTYKWKSSGLEGQGFIAHELAEICPDAVTGDKDAVGEEQYEVTPAVKDEEGNTVIEAVMGTRIAPVYQGIDTSFLVATLTAAIQELKAIVDAQGAEIAALKGATA